MNSTFSKLPEFSGEPMAGSSSSFIAIPAPILLFELFGNMCLVSEAKALGWILRYKQNAPGCVKLLVDWRSAMLSASGWLMSSMAYKCIAPSN